MEKQKKIIFEGSNSSGKSTLIMAMRQECKDIEFADRAFISDRVYAYKFNRDIYLGVDINTYLSFWEQHHANMLDTRIILCRASLDDVTKRSIQKDEDFARNRTFEQVKDYLKQEQEEFDFWTRHITSRYKFPLLVLDTSNLTVEECLEKIREFIK